MKTLIIALLLGPLGALSFGRSAVVTLTPKDPRFVHVWVAQENPRLHTAFGCMSGASTVEGPRRKSRRGCSWRLRQVKSASLRADLSPWPGRAVAVEAGPETIPVNASGFDLIALRRTGHLTISSSIRKVSTMRSISFTLGQSEQNMFMRFVTYPKDWISNRRKPQEIGAICIRFLHGFRRCIVGGVFQNPLFFVRCLS